MALTRWKICRIACIFIISVLVFVTAGSYMLYRERKDVLLTHLSERVGSIIGHKVSIGNMVLTYPDGLYLYDIQIQNPESFQPGNLLTIKKVFLEADIKALLSGRLVSDGITVFSPKLFLIKDSEGQLNISDIAKSLLRKETSSRYQYEVGHFRIISGQFVVQQDDASTYAVDLDIRNISSDPGAKTRFHAAVTNHASGKMVLDGWASISDSPQKFDIAISAENVQGAVLEEFFEMNYLDTTKVMAELNVAIKGDTERGAAISAQIKMTDAGTAFRKMGIQQVGLDLASFYDISKDTVFIHEGVLIASEKPVVTVQGEIRDLSNMRAYEGEMKIDELDLSDINFSKEVRIGGKMSSDKLRFTGTFHELVPKISGSVKLRDGYLQGADFTIDNLQARMKLSRTYGSAEASADISARVLKTRVASLREPLAIDLSIHAQKGEKQISLTTDIDLSPIHMSVGKEQSAFVPNTRIMLTGSLERRNVSADVSLVSDVMTFGTYSLSNVESTFHIQYANGILLINDLRHTTNRLSGSLDTVAIQWIKGKKNIAVKIKEMDTLFDSKKIGLKAKNVDLDIKRTDPLSGTLNFSGATFIIKHREIAEFSGTAVMDSGKVSLSVPESQLSGGRMQVQAHGTVPSKLFPLSIDILTEDLDMAILSEIGSAFMPVPYLFSGKLDKAVFHGSIHDLQSVAGRASVQSRKLSVQKSKDGGTIVKNASIKADILASGKDIEFHLEPSAGVLSARLSGSGKDIFSDKATYRVNILIPESGINEIRNSFWDVIPDRMLYAGLGGSIAADVELFLGKKDMGVKGDLHIKDLFFEEEFGKYAIGPINGSIPISYWRDPVGKVSLTLPAFNRTVFDERLARHSDITGIRDHSRITIDSFRYGFRLIEDMILWVRQEGDLLNIASLSGSIFSGKLYGSAIIHISDRPRYDLGLVLKGLRLSDLCDNIEPIRGYISGRVDGIAHLKGAGGDLNALIGKADFWTYSDASEKTMISKEFLRKVGGPSVRVYLGNRSYDKGLMSLSMEDGFVIFRELELSNRNFIGIQDLSLKVAPLNNRIRIDHFMWTIVEAATRAGKSRQ